MNSPISGPTANSLKGESMSAITGQINRLRRAFDWESGQAICWLICQIIENGWQNSTPMKMEAKASMTRCAIRPACAKKPCQR